MDQTNSNDIAVEAGPPQVFSESPSEPTKLTHTTLFLEAAALLTLWSVLVVNEGAIRLIDSNPVAGLSGGGRPPPVVLFLGGLLEVAFGMTGLFIGMAAFVFRWYNTNVTKLGIAISTLFGYYVFAVFVFIQPAYRAADLTDPMLEGLTIGQSRLLITMGIFTSFHFCLALQGGQFVFFCRLICAGTGRDFLKQNTGNTMRAIFWNANLALSGLWTLITGVVVHANVGGGTLDAPFQAPPNVGRLPSMTIWTGVLLISFGLTGIAIAVRKMRVPSMYYIFGGYTYLSAFLNFTIVQFGLLNMAPAGAVALHAGLVIMVVFMGPYFVHLASIENDAAKYA